MNRFSKKREKAEPAKQATMKRDVRRLITLDAQNQSLLDKQGMVWEYEQDAAMILRKPIPNMKLTRASSHDRRTFFAGMPLAARIGGAVAQPLVKDNLAATRPAAAAAVSSVSRARRDSEVLPQRGGTLKDGTSAIVRSYQHSADHIKMMFSTKPKFRPFQPKTGHIAQARRSLIGEYSELKSRVRKMNPYADVEPVFQRARPLQRPRFVDPYKNLPYVDQDNALEITIRARRFRIKIAATGLLDETGQGQEYQDARDRVLRNAGSMFNIREAWSSVPSQPTWRPKRSAKELMLLGDDPEIVREQKWIAPTPRRGQSLVSVNSTWCLLFGGVAEGTFKGGMYTNSLFKLVTNQPHWEIVDTTGSKPSPRAFHYMHLVDESKLILFGGLGKHGNMNDCYDLDLLTLQWNIMFQYGDETPAARHGHSMTETHHEGTCVLFGGAGSGFFNDIFFLDARTGRWTKLLPKGNPPAPRAFHTACSLGHNTKVFIFGGQNGSSTLNDLYELDLESLTWTFVRTSGLQPSPRWGHCAVPIGMDLMLCFGGAGDTFFNDLLVFNSFKQTWRMVHGLGNVPAGRWGHSMVVREQGQKSQIVVCCGCTKEKAFMGDAHLFDCGEMKNGPPPASTKTDKNEEGMSNTEEFQVGALKELLTVNDEQDMATWKSSSTNTRRWSAPRSRVTSLTINKQNYFVRKAARTSTQRT